MTLFYKNVILLFMLLSFGATQNGFSNESEGLCFPGDITFTQADCDGDLPVILMEFQITGGCYVEDLFWQVDGGGYTSANLPDLDIIIEDGGGINLTNTTADALYQVYYTLNDGTISSVYTWNNGNCLGSVEGCTNEFATNYNPEANTEDGSCLYDETICDCIGNEHTIGVLTWLGDTFADQSDYTWDGLEVNFDCSTWGYDCGDIDGAPTDDPYSVCDGFLPPNNGCTGDCSADNIAFEQLECADNGDGLLPVFNMTFSITGDCYVEDLFWQIDGGGYTFANLPDAGFDVFDGGGISLTNTTENSLYEVYFTLSDGSQSAVYTFNNGNCTDCSADNIAFTQMECADNGGGILPVFNMVFSISGDCYVEDLYWQVDGGGYTFENMPDAGFDLFDGDNINLINTTENSLYEVYFTLSDGSESAVYTFFNGNCTNCSADNITFEQLDCEDNGDGVLPVFNLNFSITGDCNVEDLFWQVNSNGYTSSNLPENGFTILDGEGINFINTEENAFYEFYFTLNDGSQSAVFTWTNGNCTGVVEGCTNPFADNYNPNAEAEDGSCVYSETICDCAGTQHSIGVLTWLGDTFADDGTYNWDEQPVDFECSTWGYDCGDFDGGPTDDPYNVCDGFLPPNNGCVEGDCTEITISITTDCWGEEVSWVFETAGGVALGTVAEEDYDDLMTYTETFCVVDGCYSFTINDQYGDGMFGSQYDECDDDGYYIITDEDGNVLAEIADPDYGDGITHDFCIETIIEGCTEIEACNYNPLAVLDDGSCDYSCYGCTDDGACNFDADATIDDESCDYSCLGCIDDVACNYDVDASIDNGSCDYSCLGCLDTTACNFDPEATVDNGTCDYEICVGCMDSTACNFSPDVTIDNGTCEYQSCLGCTDDGACNFDPEATISDDSCEYETCAGCTDDGACNFDAEALIDDESCEYETCAGCTDDGACNFDSEALIDDESCEYETCAGCIDEGACNFDPEALIEDESCEYETCAGCTDSAAINYNAEATIDDDSCIYDCEYPAIEYETYCDDENTSGFFITMTISDIGNGSPYTVSNNQTSDEIQLSFNGAINLGPFDNAEDVLISVTSNTLAGCFLTSPILTMDCAVGIEELDVLGFDIYPNPNSGTFMLEIGEYSGKAIVDCYDLTGRVIYSSEMFVQANNQKEITLNGDLAKGSYFLRIETTQGIVTKQLIIE